MSILCRQPAWHLVAFTTLLMCGLPSHAENLTQALDWAVVADLKLSAGQRQVDAAASMAQAAPALALPRVSAEALYTRLSDQPAMNLDLSKFVLPATVLPLADQEFGAYRVGATLPIYTGGRISYSIDAADQGLARVENTLDVVGAGVVATEGPTLGARTGTFAAAAATGARLVQPEL